METRESQRDCVQDLENLVVQAARLDNQIDHLILSGALPSQVTHIRDVVKVIANSTKNTVRESQRDLAITMEDGTIGKKKFNDGYMRELLEKISTHLESIHLKIRGALEVNIESQEHPTLN